VLDFNMPDRDGLHLAADLRALDAELPLAVISANHQKEIVDRTTAIGATFLPKEPVLREFLDQAEQRLKGRK
jgi:DNA-binding NarL/FixJ family response regulator